MYIGYCLLYVYWLNVLCYPSTAIGFSHAQQYLVNIYIALFVPLLPIAQQSLVGQDPLFNEAS
jgi:hypothetical protein